MQINNFFQTLSKSLWTIDKHPFRKMGEFENGAQSRELSYDPSRVFKREDEQNVFEKDNDYIEFQRQQRFNNLVYDKNRLVEELRQKHQKIKIKRSDVVKSNKDVYNPFLHERERCIACKECLQFEGNFRMNKIGGVGIFACMNCGCPMNAHRQIVKDKLFSNLLYNNLKDKDLNDQSMYGDMFVIALSLDDSRNRTGLTQIINMLGQGGYTVLSYDNLHCSKFEQKFVQKKLFSQKIRTQTLNQFESMLNFIKIIHDNSSDEVDFSSINHEQSLESKIKQYKFLVSEVKQELNLQGEQVVCLLIHCSRNRRSNYFKFIETVGKLLKNITSFYYSLNNYESLIDCQIFFPSFSEIRYQTFLPFSMNQKSSYAIKDILDLNQYIIVKDSVENVKKADVDRAFKLIGNPMLADCILGSSVVSEIVNHINIKFVAKIGVSQLTTYGQMPPYLRFQQPQLIQSMMKNLCGKLLESQRCAIILRPSLTSFGLDNLILNYLRINNFNIIGRKSVSLSPQQMRMMQIFENISEQDSGHYAEMMKGLVQVVLVSKRRAIMESKIIAEGCSYGIKKLKTRVIRQQPQFHVEINNKQYIQELHVFEPKYWQQPSISTFNGVKNLFNLQNMIFDSSEKLQSAQLVEADTGSVIKEVKDYSVHKKKINSKLKQAILEEMNGEIFNFWMYTSVSETISEQIVNQFMPECALYQSICLIVKPGYTHLSSVIKQALQFLKFKVIFSKTLILSKMLAGQLVKELLVVRNQQTEKSLINKYSTERVQILCVSKESAKREMLYFLRSFNLQSKKQFKETQFITDDVLKQVLVPVWQNQQSILQIFHPVLEDIQKSLMTINRLQRNDIFNLLVYLVGSMVGQQVKQLPLKTSIGELSYMVSKNQQQTRIQSWYYSLVNQTSPLFVPLLFQHRQYGKISFILQSSIGQELFKNIFRSYVQNKNEMTKGGRSLVLFIWAKKLSDMVADLSQINPPLNGFENIDKFGDTFRGEIPDDSYRSNQIERVKEFIKIWMERDREVVHHLERSLSKRGFEERWKLKNKRLLPKVDDGNLRAVKSSRLSKLILKDEIEMIDPNNELTRAAQLLTINLYNIVPQQMPKYWLWCQVYTIILKHSQNGSRFKEPAEQFLELFIQVSNKQIFEDLEMLAIELYLHIVKRYQEGEAYLLPLVKLGLLDFKRLGKLNDVDDTSGKKRKFIPKVDHTKKQQPDHQLLETVNKFNQYVYNVYSDAPKPDENSLFRKRDPLHQTWVKQKRIVNLIRQVSAEKQPRKGVYVEYEKKLNENEEQLKRRVEEQAIKYSKQEEKILYDEDAGNKNIWYRKKIQTTFKPKPRMEEAIERQLIKLMQFKQQNK